VIVLEGGYDLGALSRSVASTMAAAVRDELPDEAPTGPLVERARGHYARWWGALA
jgi:acetoin utilization deacetylase AcuC-like enzyme